MIPSSFPPKHMARVFEIRHGDGGKPLAWWKVAEIAKSEGIKRSEGKLRQYARDAEQFGIWAWVER